MESAGVCWGLLESARLVDSGGFRRTPADSSRLQQTHRTVRTRHTNLAHVTEIEFARVCQSPPDSAGVCGGVYSPPKKAKNWIRPDFKALVYRIWISDKVWMIYIVWYICATEVLLSTMAHLFRSKITHWTWLRSINAIGPVAWKKGPDKLVPRSRTLISSMTA